MNISGKPGLIYVPTATETKEGTFQFGVNYNPIDYGFRFNKKNSENIYFINATLIPRLEVNVNLLRINNEKINGQKGIGDRQIDLKYLILKEKKYQPSLRLSSPLLSVLTIPDYKCPRSNQIVLNYLAN